MSKKDDFIAELIALCEKHKMTLVDYYGYGVCVNDFDDNDIQIIKDAFDNTEEGKKLHKQELEEIRQALKKQSPYGPADGVFYT